MTTDRIQLVFLISSSRFGASLALHTTLKDSNGGWATRTNTSDRYQTGLEQLASVDHSFPTQLSKYYLSHSVFSISAGEMGGQTNRWINQPSICFASDKLSTYKDRNLEIILTSFQLFEPTLPETSSSYSVIPATNSVS
jgi:hypothetical protein